MNPLAKSAVVTGNTAFGIALLQELAPALKPEENLLLSPYSVSQAVLLAVNGSKGSMQTHLLGMLSLDTTPMDTVNRDSQALMELLVPSVQKESGKSILAYEWTVTNAIWTLVPPNQDFIDTCTRYYSADVLPFVSVSAVNLWSNEETRGRIPQIMNPTLDWHIELLFTNIVYFKGKWETPFSPSDTRNGPFYGIRRTSAKPFMNREDRQMRWYVGKNCEAVSLPYRGGMSMVIVLPQNGVSPAEWIASLSRDEWQTIQSHFQPEWIALSLPRFEVEYDQPVDKPLESLGMPKSGDFSPIAHPLNKAVISHVLHKTFLRVDEEGSEATAVTEMGPPPGFGAPEPEIKPRPFVVNRPFVCAIVHDTTGTVLFLGVINDPKITP